MKVYYAVSNLAKGMTDGEGDIQMDEVTCGAIFMGELDANYNVSSVRPVLMGGKLDANDNCPDDAISGPDNLYVDSKGNLWIGEDSGEPNEALCLEWNCCKRFAPCQRVQTVTGLHHRRRVQFL